MKLKKSVQAVLFATSAIVATGAQAITLKMDNGSTAPGGITAGTLGVGSYFTMEFAPLFHFATSVNGRDGIIVGGLQPASGSHAGAPDGSESPGIDQAWLFNASTGMHASTSPTNALSTTATGMILDFSGWDVTWNGLASIPMGAGAWADGTAGTGSNFTNLNGQANVNCYTDGTFTTAASCTLGNSYTLQYSGTVPVGDPSNFGGTKYSFTSTGTVVPVPAAVWLFGSGLVGLVGIARRKKQQA